MDRIRLTFARNKDESTKGYRVFRRTRKSVTRRDELVMEISHPILPKPIKHEEEVMSRETGYLYRTKYISIMGDENLYPIQVWINSIEANTLGIQYGVDFPAGEVSFSAAINESDEVKITYWSDSIRVTDSDEIEQEGVKYFGPTAKDRTEPEIPGNVILLPDVTRGRIVMNWSDALAEGQTYFYRIEAVDGDGNFSNLSAERSAFIKETDMTQGYLIERSYDGLKWTTVSRQIEREYVEYGIDQDPPNPPQGVKASVAGILSTGTSDVKLSWKASDLGVRSQSGRYRVRSISASGILSAPSLVVGPIYLTSALSHYVIRRKLWDGSFPSYEGSDAETAARVPGTEIAFEDKGVPDNSQYAYSIFAVDAAGNRSIAATLLVQTTDTTAPPAATNLRAVNYSYLI